MELVVDDQHPGTDERTWLGTKHLRELRPLRFARPPRVVIVAPHPDDEVLAAGGLLQMVSGIGAEIAVIAVTNGEASHPGARAQGYDLGATRALEAQIALQRLGCDAARIQRLGLPDGAVSERIPDLTDALSRVLRPDDLCVAPWRSDGHPDHDATGSAAVAAARVTGTPVLEYLVWTWHWATPDSALVPWSRCRRLALGRRQMARKRWATYAYASQIRPFADDRRPLLTDAILRRFWRPFEVFVEPES
jgi:LmbE family N-acetylglucosaminyl deacetylase